MAQFCRENLGAGMSRNFAGYLVLSASLVSFANPALASEYIMDIQAEQGQPSAFEAGQEYIDDVKPGTVVRLIEPRPSSSKQGTIAIAILNRSGSALNFGPENVTIKLSDGSVVSMLDYNELMRRQKKREGWQRFAMAMAAGSRGAAASQAGNNYGTATYSGYSNGIYGSTPYNSTTQGTATYSGYNGAQAYAAQAQANAQTQQDIEVMRANQNAQRAQIGRVMQTTTVSPGQVFGGIVQYDIPKPVRSKKVPVPIVIEIRAGSEVHTFRGTLTKR